MSDAAWLRAVAGAALVSACSVSHEPGVRDVQRFVHGRTGQTVHWLRDSGHNQQVADAIRTLMDRPLTIVAAEKIALLNNRRLQAHFERLGIAQADLFQAGLIANPHVGVGVLIPTVGTPSPTVEGDFGINFLSVFTIAARKRVAQAELDAVVAEVAHDILDAVFDVRVAYYRFQTAQQLAHVNHTIASTAQASFDTAVALHEAGNINELQLAQEQALYEQMRMDLLDSEADVGMEREQLNRLLGLWGHDAQRWTVVAKLAAIPRDELQLDQLARLAMKSRLDLIALRRRSAMLAQALRMAGDFAWLQHFEVGAGIEREHDHPITVGPSLSAQLPIFDQGQGQTARLRAALRRSYHETTARAVDIRAEVRSLRVKLVRHRRKSVHFRDVVIPLRERIVKLMMRQYNFMLVGAFDLLQHKRREAEAYRDYLSEVRDYWVTRSELTRAVGGRLPTADVAAASSSD